MTNLTGKRYRWSIGKKISFVIIILAMIVSVFPLLYMMTLSFMETTTMKLSVDRIVNGRFSFDNYRKLFRHSDILMYFKNSVIIAIYSVAINCLLCPMAAYGFAKKKFPGKDRLFVVYLATMMIPGQVTLIPTFLILHKLGMLNTYSAIGLTSVGAFGVLLIHQFLEKLPNELLEAADIDGCGEIHKYFKIVVPLIKPSIVSLAIFTFIGAWGNLILPLIMLTAENMTTLPVAIANMHAAQNVTDYGYQMASASLSFFPPFIMYIFMQKQFVEGIALSGLKG